MRTYPPHHEIHLRKATEFAFKSFLPHEVIIDGRSVGKGFKRSITYIYKGELMARSLAVDDDFLWSWSIQGVNCYSACQAIGARPP